MLSMQSKYRLFINILITIFSVMIMSLGVSFSALVETRYSVTMAAGKGDVPNYSCNVLYGAPDGAGQNIYEVDVQGSNGSTVLTSALMRAAANQYNSTIALGPAGSVNGTKTMFFWPYAGAGRTTAVQEGNSLVYELSPARPSAANGYNWSGGEVNQMTGEIYYSGQEGTSTDGAGNYWSLMKFNPVTGDYVRNPGRIPPLTAMDRPAQNRYVSSDMAIDANGNVYVIAYYGNNKSVIRYNITDPDPSRWTYTTVFEFPSTAMNITGNTWGMAFLNGKLYLGTASRYIYEINLLQQTIKNLGRTTPLLLDLASCQVAPVIEGTLYQDVQGSGQIDENTAPRISGQEVEIWKKTGSQIAYQSTINTSGSGDFSFILDDSRGEYYIRFVNANIKGSPSVQTWVSSSKDVGYSITNYCYDMASSSIFEHQGTSAVCLGAPTDAPKKSGAPSEWSSFVRVQLNSDRVVPNLKLAFSSIANYADAPASYNDGNVGPSHISLGISGNTVTNDQLNVVHLGKTVSTTQGNMPSDSADSIPTHDGVEVALAGSTDFKSLQDYVFVTGEEYDIRINVEGAEAERAYLSAWLAMSGSSRTNNFQSGTVLLTDRQMGSDSNIVVRYRAPEGVVTSTASYARFRVSSAKGLTPTESSTATKIIDGEVEDYRIYFVPGEISIATKALGGTGSFSYNFSNILSNYPSTVSSTIDVLTEDDEYNDASRHVFDRINQSIVITQTSPTTNWTLIDVSCQVGQQTINDIEFTDEGNITIPGKHVVGGSQISCLFTNSLGPRLELIKSITDREHADDQFVIQIKE